MFLMLPLSEVKQISFRILLKTSDLCNCRGLMIELGPGLATKMRIGPVEQGAPCKGGQYKNLKINSR